MPLRDASGRLRGFAKIPSDNTAAKGQEDLLRDQRDQLAATLDSLPGVFYMFDSAGHFLRWNANLERVTGYSAEEIARITPLDFFRGEDRRHIEERIGGVGRQAVATGRGQTLHRGSLLNPRERVALGCTGLSVRAA
ncbi:MAG: PAS domain S-box protein [Pyrinomonadaceae bacterium]